MTCKKSLLVKSKISKLFPNKLSADAKYSLLKWDNLMQPIQMQFSPKKQNIFSIFFVHFWNLVYILNISKKKTALIAHIFTNYRLRKTWLDQFLNGPVSRDTSESNIVNEPKHCSNLNGSTFTIFIDHCEEVWVAKSSC